MSQWKSILVMRNYTILFLACFAVALIITGNVEAIEPDWNYTTGDHVRSVAISADGEYVVVGSDDNHLYLFDKNNVTPLWNYSTGNDEWSGDVISVDISADGEYIVAGSEWPHNKVYLFNKDNNNIMPFSFPKTPFKNI